MANSGFRNWFNLNFTELLESLLQPSTEDLPNKKVFGYGSYEQYILIISAALLKADSKIRIKKLKWITFFFIDNFGLPEKVCMKKLAKLLNSNLRIETSCLKIKKCLNYSSILHVLLFMYRIAAAQNIITPKELVLI